MLVWWSSFHWPHWFTMIVCWLNPSVSPSSNDEFPNFWWWIPHVWWPKSNFRCYLYIVVEYKASCSHSHNVWLLNLTSFSIIFQPSSWKIPAVSVHPNQQINRSLDVNPPSPTSRIRNISEIFSGWFHSIFTAFSREKTQQLSVTSQPAPRNRLRQAEGHFPTIAAFLVDHLATWRFVVQPGNAARDSWGLMVDMGVLLKMLCKPRKTQWFSWSLYQLYPYEKWLFHWEY